MIEFSASGEIDKDIAESYRTLRNSLIATLNNELSQNDYGHVVKKIFIAPIIVKPNERFDRQERKLFKKAKGIADYRLKIDFDEWHKGNDSDRESLLVKNLITSIEDIQRKLGKEFNGEKLIKDILVIF